MSVSMSEQKSKKQVDLLSSERSLDTAQAEGKPKGQVPLLSLLQALAELY